MLLLVGQGRDWTSPSTFPFLAIPRCISPQSVHFTWIVVVFFSSLLVKLCLGGQPWVLRVRLL